jgi:hypothetical protein
MWSDWQEKVKPDAKIPSHLLWDMDLEKFDLQKGKAIVAERVAERGTLEDFYTMFAMYGGVEKVREIYKNEVRHIDAYALPFICAAFDLKKEEMNCYIRKQLREKLLNS